jgi:hypothetical protein
MKSHLCIRCLASRHTLSLFILSLLPSSSKIPLQRRVARPNRARLSAVDTREAVKRGLETHLTLELLI